MAIRAGLSRNAGLLVPQRLAVEHREHAGIFAVVVLHGAGIGADEVAVGATLVERHCRRNRDGGDECGKKDKCGQAAHGPSHATVIAAVCTWVWPCWSVQENVSVPLSVATVKNETYGLAAIAGKN